ncbi:hypothetical protein EAF04_006170 [Stromatinia cepivora]|nr:hypothetical protein EAF04_006170 [Stromatinia cepivora]
MDNDCDCDCDCDCGCSSRTKGVRKTPILTGDYDISWAPMLSALSCKKCAQVQKTDFSSSPKQSRSSTTSEASYFQLKASDHYYNDLDSTHIPLPFSSNKSPYSYKKHNLLAGAVPIPHRTSSLAFRPASKNPKKMYLVQQSLPSSRENSDCSGSSSSLNISGKHLEHVQKVLEDIRTWHKEVSISISRSHLATPKSCHQNNFNIVSSQVSRKQKNRRLGSASMDALQQKSSWAQVFDGGYTTPRRYASRSLCPGSNISPIWKIDPVPSSIYKPKPTPNIGTKRSPRPIPSPRTSSLGATMCPRRRNAVRGRILPKPVSIVCSNLEQHSCQAQLTGSSLDCPVLDAHFAHHWDGESALANNEENTKINTIHSPATPLAQPSLSANLEDQSWEGPGCQSHDDGLPHSGTVIRLSARHSSLQASESIFATPSSQESEDEEKAKRHIAFVHSALRDLVPFEVSDYLYRVSQSRETFDDSGETFLDEFSDATPPYIKSNSVCQSSEALGQDGCHKPGSNFSLRRVSNEQPPLHSPDAIDVTNAWAPGTAI